MSTAMLAAPAAPLVESRSFVLRIGDRHVFSKEGLDAPLIISLRYPEVGHDFLLINERPMNAQWLRQTVGPSPGPDANMSVRLRRSGNTGEMPRENMRWTYTIPGIVTFRIRESTVKNGKKKCPQIHFEVVK